MTTVTKQTNTDKAPVAADIFTYCTREKVETWHVVRNHGADGIVDKVICKACGSEHKYRRSAAPKGTSKKAPLTGRMLFLKGPGKKPALSAAANSEALMEAWLRSLKKWGDKPLRAFSPDQNFAQGEVLTHSAFGKGVVQVWRENKIDVLFESGIKTLPSKKA